MIINSIYLQHFRSFDSKGRTLHLSQNSNIILGENNIGKTSILEALRILCDLKGLNPEDFHKRDTKKPVIISIKCTLDSDQIERIISHLHLPYSADQFVDYFSNQFEYSYEYHSGRVLLTIKFGSIYIENYENHSIGYITTIDRTEGSRPVTWESVLIELNKDSSSNPNDVLTNLQRNYLLTASGNQFVFSFTQKVHEFIGKTITEKIIPLEEYCEKSQSKSQKGTVCRTGKYLASILSQLKNGPIEPKRKYEEIRTEFSNLFPNLDMESIIEDENYQIQIQNGEFTSTTNYIGSGIHQTLFLITHVIAHPDKVLCIDEPELHLHPQIQKGLSSLLFDKKDHQMLIVTHSSYFIDISPKSAIHRATQEKNLTNIISFSSSMFSDQEIAKLEQVLDIDSRELFFARKVILVEGESEIGGLPIFSRHFNYDFNKNGISVIFVDGKYGFKIFVKLCQTCKIPYLIIADNNAEEVIAKLIEKFPDVKFNHFLLSVDDFIQLFPESLIDEAKKEYKKSKPRQGRYIARKIVESHLEVPEDIKKIFNKLKE